MNKKIYTIGHSIHPIEMFLGHLKKHDITVVCDVRSSPYSRYNPQYNRESLKICLSENSIKYVFLGKELGARSDDPACYEEGKVQYDRLAETDLFKNGLKRVEKGAKDYAVALMCAEKDPLECHRTILVSRELERKGFSIFHILDDGEVEAHESAIARLIERLNLGGGDLFMTERDIRNKAYEIQGDAIGYSIADRKDQQGHTNVGTKE